MLVLLEEVDERGMETVLHSARISSRRTSASEYSRLTGRSSISTNLEVANDMVDNYPQGYASSKGERIGGSFELKKGVFCCNFGHSTEDTGLINCNRWG